MTKDIFKISILILFLICAAFTSPCLAESQVGWLDGWKYRKCVIFHNYSDTELSDYQIKVINPVYKDEYLSASWHFEKIEGDIVYDDSGNRRNAVIYGAKQVDTKFGKGLEFNGKDSYVDAGNAGLIKTIEFCIEDEKYANGILELNPDAYISIASGKISAVGIAGPQIYVNGKLDGALFSGLNHVAITTDTAIEASAVKIGVAKADYTKGIIDELRLYEWKLPADLIDLRNRARASLNYSDIRFTDADGLKLLSHYMEKDGVFWVKIPYLYLDKNYPIYLYYGSDKAEALSDPQAVFDFFEDFEGDLSKWQSSGWTVTNQTQDGGAAAKTNNAQLIRKLSLPASNMRKVLITAAVDGDLVRNYLSFYENSQRKIIWEETAGWVEKAIDLNSADPTIRFVLNSDGEHSGKINRIMAYKDVGPEKTVTADIYTETSKD